MFKKEKKEIDMNSHDFSAIVKKAREDASHFERVQSTFKKLITSAKDRKK